MLRDFLAVVGIVALARHHEIQMPGQVDIQRPEKRERLSTWLVNATNSAGIHDRLKALQKTNSLLER